MYTQNYSALLGWTCDFMPQKSNTSSVLSLIRQRPYPPSNTTVACRAQAQWAYCDNPAPLQSQWTTPFTMPALAAVNYMQAVSAADTQGQNQGTAGPISALWECDQDEDHHQTQLDIGTQFGPNPPGGLGARSRRTDRQTALYVNHVCLFHIMNKVYDCM